MQTFKLYHRVAIAMVTISITACSTYYKANSINPVISARKVDSLNKINRYFVLRNDDESFAIKNLALSADLKTAQCTLDSLPFDHQLHLSNGKYGRMRYNNKDPLYNKVINEVHYYMPKDSTVAIGGYTLQLEKLTKIEILEHDKVRTKNSRVLGTVLITGSIIVVSVGIYGIVLATALAGL